MRIMLGIISNQKNNQKDSIKITIKASIALQ